MRQLHRLTAIIYGLWLAVGVQAQPVSASNPIVDFGTTQTIIPAGAMDIAFEAVVQGLTDRQGDMGLFLYPVQDLEFGEGIAVHRGTAPLPGQLGRWRWNLRRTGTTPTAICMLSDGAGRDARASVVRIAQGDLFTIRSGQLALRVVRTTAGLAGWVLVGSPGGERLVSVIAPLAMASASADGAPFHQTPIRSTGVAVSGGADCRVPVSLGDGLSGQLTVSAIPQPNQLRLTVSMQTIRPTVIRWLALSRLVNDDRTAFETGPLSITRTVAGATASMGSLQMSMQAGDAPTGGVVEVLRESERAVLPWAELRWTPVSNQPLPIGVRVQWSMTLQWLPAETPVP